MTDKIHQLQQAEADVARLMKLAREKSLDGRRSLVNALADMFEESNFELAPRELSTMRSILRQLVTDAEKEIKRAVAERFAEPGFLPGDVAYSLAIEEIEVAFPILLKSDLLKDLELVEIIRNRTFEHQLAIAQRQRVGAAVSDALIETDREVVIMALLENTGAKISAPAMERLVEESRAVTSYQDPLLHRSELGEELAKRMFVWVSAALRGHIISRFQIDADEADDLLASVSADISAPVPQSAAEELAAELAQSGPISADLLANALRDGEVQLFEALLREATRLRQRLVERILFEPGGEGLAIALKSLDCPQDAFERIFKTSRRARLVGEATIKREVRNLSSFYPRNIKTGGGESTGALAPQFQLPVGNS